MNANQPNIKPLEPISFDDLVPEAPEPTTGIPGAEPLDPAELPVPEGGSLKEKIIAQAKKEEAEVAAVEAAKEEVKVDQPAPASEVAIVPEAVPAATQPEAAPVIPPAAPDVASTPTKPEPVPPEKPVLPEKPVVPEIPTEQIESLPIPESKAEEAPAETEQPKPSAGKKVQDQPVTPPAVVAPPVSTQPEKTETRKQIETILQEGLAPIFLQMDQKERQAFTLVANETASKLEVLVTQFKASAKEVLRLLKAWLLKIPKVNKYFLEQASKIKTDEILQVQAQKKKESRLLH